MAMSKPLLAIMVGKAMKDKGMKAADSEEMPEDSSDGDSHDEHLQQIADDMMDAIHAKDSQALKELLQEAFECMDAAPHKEGPHEESDY